MKICGVQKYPTFLWQNKYVDDFENQLFATDLRQKIWRRSLALTKNKEDAKDLMQDTFLKALEKREQFSGGYLDRWVYTICRNIFYDKYRKIIYAMKDGDATVKEKKEYLAGDDLPEQSTEGFQNLVDAENDFEFCLKELGEVDREIMSMTIKHSSDEICELFDISNSNLRTKISRARSQLAECMGVFR